MILEGFQEGMCGNCFGEALVPAEVPAGCGTVVASLEDLAWQVGLAGRYSGECQGRVHSVSQVDGES